jgi:hypothetical protein
MRVGAAAGFVPADAVIDNVATTAAVCREGDVGAAAAGTVVRSVTPLATKPSAVTVIDRRTRLRVVWWRNLMHRMVSLSD